jgi:hypothetical protein
LYSGRLDEAVEVGEILESSAGRVGDSPRALAGATVSALAHAYAGDRLAAGAAADRVMAHAQRNGSPSAHAWAHYVMGEAMAGADPAAARTHLQQALDLGESVGSDFAVGVAEVTLASLQAESTDVEAALASFHRLIVRWDAINDWTHQWTTLQNLAPVVLRSGLTEETAVLVGALAAHAGERPLFGTAADRIASIRDHISELMGEEQVQGCFDRGAAMPRSELVQYVLRLTNPSHAKGTPLPGR